jgi:O-antigen/teichoic acid export membrane protein
MKVLSNAFWLSFSRIGADVLSFVLFAAISRTFGPGGTGEYSYAFAVATLVALTATAGFEDYGIRQYSHAASLERPQLWQDILTTQVIQLLIAAAGLAVFASFSALRLSEIVVVLELAVYVVGWTMSYTFFIPAYASQFMMVPALTDLTCRMTAIVTALVLTLLFHRPLPWVLAGFPLAGLALAALSLRSALAHGASLKLARSWRGVVSTWKKTSAFVGSEILNQFYARADILLIAYFLGDASVGLYATDIKFVEVGILPLVLLGTAAYPLLSRHAALDPPAFKLSARDFSRIVFFASGWLAIGLYWLLPLLIVPLFGAKFAPSVALLPLFALFVLMKAWEVAFYRVLYSVKRQLFYCYSLIVGTVVIVALNLWLIPAYGLTGAIAAAIASILVVDAICAGGLRRELGGAFMAALLVRLAIALGLAGGAAVLAREFARTGPLLTCLLACALYPVFGAILGLVPHPRHSPLLRQAQGEKS